jgi:hypothetical protein
VVRECEFHPSDLGQGPVAFCCKHGSEPSNSKKSENSFPDERLTASREHAPRWS